MLCKSSSKRNRDTNVFLNAQDRCVKRLNQSSLVLYMRNNIILILQFSKILWEQAM